MIKNLVSLQLIHKLISWTSVQQQLLDTIVASKPQWSLFLVFTTEGVILLYCIQKQDMTLRGDLVIHKTLLETIKSEFIRVHVFILM